MSLALSALTSVAVPRLDVAGALLTARRLALARAVLLHLLGTRALGREVVLWVDT